jgi:hypothetical protein
VSRTGIRALAVAAALILAGLPAAAWAAAPQGEYAHLATGTATFGVAGIPDAGVHSTSYQTAIASGSSMFLGPSTPFGAKFGSSQGKPYFTFRPASNGSPSVTTLTFDHPMPAGPWGFTLGDVDADTVKVKATGTSGSALSTADLGFQSSFNYCGFSPKPSGCGSGTHTDKPTWNAATSTLVGSGIDTSGGAGWFQPTKPIKKLTLTFTVLTGKPVFQLWLAVLTSTITGCAKDEYGHGVAGATVHLLDSAGDPVKDSDGNPVTTTTGGDGTYTFSPVAAMQYKVSFTPPADYKATGPTTESVDASATDHAQAACFTATVVPEAPAETVDVPPGETSVIFDPPKEVAKHVEVTITKRPHHGTAWVTPHNKIKYRPDPGFAGTDRVGYCVARKGKKQCGTITVKVVPRGCRLMTPVLNADRPRMC